MSVFRLDDVAAKTVQGYHEFLRVPAMSAGVYRLPAGAKDPQSPHHEDEIYIVTAGRGTLQVGSAEHAVSAGSIVHVPTGVEHRFHSIAEPLTTLVVFAPAESA